MVAVNPQTEHRSVAAPPQAAHRRGEARRAEIVRIAGEVFLQEGYAAASMSAIAARVGGSKGTLYNHFPSKQALFTAFLEQACALEASQAFDFADYDGDLPAALHQSGRRLLRFLMSDMAAAVHRVVIAEGARFPELGRTFYEIGPKVGVGKMARFLEQEMAAGRLRRADPERAAEQFLALCKAGLHQRRQWAVITDASEAEIDANVAAAVELFLAGYAARS